MIQHWLLVRGHASSVVYKRKVGLWEVQRFLVCTPDGLHHNTCAAPRRVPESELSQETLDGSNNEVDFDIPPEPVSCLQLLLAGTAHC